MTTTRTVFPVELIANGKPNDTVFVLGATGSGKSTLIANLAKKRDRVIIFDTKEDYPPAFFGAEVATDSLQLVSLLNNGKEKIVVQLWHQDDMDQNFCRCLAVVMRWHNLNQNLNVETTIVVDECNNFAHVNSCPPEFRDIIMRGRSVGIRKIFGASWFNTIPTFMRETFTEIYCFKHTDPNGVAMLGQYGFIAEEIMTLPQYTVAYSGKNKLEQFALIPSKTAKQPNKTN